jgi:hypothetical protein
MRNSHTTTSSKESGIAKTGYPAYVDQQVAKDSLINTRFNYTFQSIILDKKLIMDILFLGCIG